MKKSERQKVVKDLRNAAEKIETKEEDCCCPAIDDQHYIAPNLSCRIFAEMFRDDAIALGHYRVEWFKGFHEFREWPSLRRRRVLGLLFCAHLVEIGEWP